MGVLTRIKSTGIFLVLLVIFSSLAVSPAYADAMCGEGLMFDRKTGECVISVGTDPTPPEGGGGGGTDQPPVGNEQPVGPRVCEFRGEELPCESGELIWIDFCKAYGKQEPPEFQEPPEGETEGAWYTCQSSPGGVGGLGGQFWSVEPPPGFEEQISPGEAAAILISRFRLDGPTIGMAPEPVDGSIGSVGLPVWMWVQNPNENTFGPYTLSDSIEGLEVSATARVDRIDWNMGDGTVITCTNPGTPYDVSIGLQPSPTCGHMYERMSKDQPGGKYTITAVSHWQIQWQAGGATGDEDVTRESTTQVAIGEMQTVIIQ